MGTRINVPGAPEGVPTIGRARNHLERSGAWGLELVGHVGVPEIELRKCRSVWSAGAIGVYDCEQQKGQMLDEKLSISAAGKCIGNRERAMDIPWTSSRPGSRGIGVVACLWRGPKWRASSSCSWMLSSWSRKTAGNISVNSLPHQIAISRTTYRRHRAQRRATP